MRRFALHPELCSVIGALRTSFDLKMRDFCDTIYASRFDWMLY
jgi:hypothetical protein